MSEIAAAGVGLGVPVVGELHGSSLVAEGGEEHVGVAAFLVRTAADLAQAEHLEEGDRVLQRAYADHGVQIFGHWGVLRSAVRGGAAEGSITPTAAPKQAPSSNSSRLAMGRLMRSVVPSPHGVGT